MPGTPSNAANLAFHGGVVDALSRAERRLPWMVARVEHDYIDAVLAQLHPHAGRHRPEGGLRGGVHGQGGQGTIGAETASQIHNLFQENER